MKYKVGDKVYLRDDLEDGNIYDGLNWTTKMLKGQIATIQSVTNNDYTLKESSWIYGYNDKMIDHEKTKGLNKVKEELKEVKYEDMVLDFGDIVQIKGTGIVGKVVGKHGKRDGTYEYSIKSVIHDKKPNELELQEKTNVIL